MRISIPASAPAHPHKRHWQFCVGSGHALLALRTDYVRQLRFIHDTLGIERVRFHGILCDDMRTMNTLEDVMPVPGGEAYTEYNFNACGVAYDNVLEAGMKPFVELSFMPGRLALREEGRPAPGLFFYRPNVVPPADREAWKRYIRAFVRYLIHRYGAEEIRTWYFEVWNEPDLPVAFWNGTRDEYFRLYEDTALAIKEVDPEIPVGGPSTSNSRWVESFLAYCREKDLPVDFVTTHQYAGDPLGGVEDQGEEGTGWAPVPEFAGESSGTRQKALAGAKGSALLDGFRALMPDKSETTDIPYGVFPANAAKVRRQAGSLPLYYTEWNENAIFSAWTNDTRKVAAYDVRAALETENDMDGSSVWCFSDIFEELHPFPEEFHGGFGMLTQQGIPKPVYHAMKMLRDVGDERLDLGEEATRGEIGYAAFRSGEGTQVLLFRQKMRNEELPPVPVELSVELGRAPEEAAVRRIDADHGNPLALWEAMGRPAMLNRAEVADLIARSAVAEEKWPFARKDGAVEMTFELGVNDVYLVSLR